LLSPLLADGLNVVFVGTEPGRESLRRGQYYADPTNGFYRHLAEAGLTTRQLRPAEFRDLIAYGIGLDVVYADPDALRARLESARARGLLQQQRGASPVHGTGQAATAVAARRGGPLRDHLGCDRVGDGRQLVEREQVLAPTARRSSRSTGEAR
jgi:uracil DNA glycosylase superfamily protein